nr:DUF3175 domain-containing protein [Afipia sp. GAS231]
MTLEDGVFKKTPRALALSLKRSAERSTRRKSSPFRSAMSMLSFYENRAGKISPPSARSRSRKPRTSSARSTTKHDEGSRMLRHAGGLATA